MKWIATVFVMILATGGLDAAGRSSVEQTTKTAFKAAIAVDGKDASCGETIGKKSALAVVRYCIYQSAATHPPCNTANSCAVIVEAIRSSCGDRGAEVDSPLPCPKITTSQWRDVSSMPAL